MPFYTVGGLRMHIKFSGRNPPAPCVARVGVGQAQHACCDISSLLCDWPNSDCKTCDAPLCAAHGREVGRNRHYCPMHFAQAQAPGAVQPGTHQLNLFTRLLEAQ